MVDNNGTATTPKPFVFVLIPFDPAFDDIYKFGIKGAAQDIGAYAERLDEQIFTEGMLDRIFNQISKADVIIADVTGRNPNVFYEVGYAHALGKVVLLLTQNSDDIPFDLKHRQHIVYSGSINTLKTELVRKLQWAVDESKRKRRPSQLERFSVWVNEVEIPRVGLSPEIPHVSGTVEANHFGLPILVRNDSTDEVSQPITHIYLFTEQATVLVPCEYRQYRPRVGLESGAVVGLSNWFPSSETLTALESFRASGEDAPDNLQKQFRLPITLPALPPRAVEPMHISMMFSESSTKVDGQYRLRLSSPYQSHDYPFSLSIYHQPRPLETQPADK